MAINLGIACQVAFSSNPTASSYTWTDISQYVVKASVSRQKQRLMQRFDAGTMTVTLNNSDRRFEPLYSGSPYYGTTGNIQPLRPIRLGFTLNKVTYWVFTGFVERWPIMSPNGPKWSEIDVSAVDAFELLSNSYIGSTYASYTWTGSFGSLVFTSSVLGYAGNGSTIRVLNDGTDPPTVSTSGTDVTIHMTTLVQSSIIANLINSDLTASTVMTAAVSGPTDLVPAFSAQPLTNGLYPSELSGSFISQVLSQIGYTNTTNIDAGITTLQAQVIQKTTFTSGGTIVVTADGSSTDALTAIQLAEQTEDGQFFIDKNGSPTFYDRQTLESSVINNAVMSLSDYPNETTTFGYNNITIDWDRDLIYNVIGGVRANGSTNINASDTTSIAKYFTRTLSLDGVLNFSDTDMQDLCQGLLGRFSTPSLRYEPVVLNPGTNVNFWKALLQLDYLDVINLSRTPPGGGQPMTDSVRVIGIQINITPALTNTQWTLNIDPNGGVSNVVILDDSTYGILDSNYLGY